MKIYTQRLRNTGIGVCCFFSLAASGQSADLRLLEFINPRHPTSVFWKFTSSSAIWLPPATAIGGLVIGLSEGDDQLRDHSLEALLSEGIGTVISEGLKYSINRERPADRYPDKVFVTSPVRGASFPSGHTTLAFAAATTLALQYKKWYVVVPVYLWAGSVGYSRMYLGKHYPTDILGGVVTGAASSLGTHWLARKMFKVHYLKHPEQY